MNIKRKINLAERMDQVDVYLSDQANMTLPSPIQTSGDTDVGSLRVKVNEILDHLRTRAGQTPPAPSQLSRSYEFGEESDEDFVQGPGILISKTTTGIVFSADYSGLWEQLDEHGVISRHTSISSNDHKLGSATHTDVDSDMIPTKGTMLYHNGVEWIALAPPSTGADYVLIFDDATDIPKWVEAAAFACP